jgi:hypothetical protein
MINDYADVIGQLSVISYQWAKGGELRAKGENVFLFALRTRLYAAVS